MNNPVILFRKGIQEEGEVETASKYFKVVTNRTLCKDQLVIGRFSVLPFYRELEKDLQFNNCFLINTHDEHCWIADFLYYHDLKEHTPESWTDDNFYLARWSGSYVVKGKTNSRKYQWNTHMFANNKVDAIKIASELRQDGLIGNQGIVYRKYEPLKTLGIDNICGIPYSNEWRFFYYKKKRLSYGYYWASASNKVIHSATIDDEGFKFANKIAEIASEYIPFFVLDIAEKEDGGWILIEMNDAQMSGLSMNNPDVLYQNLCNCIGSV